MSLKIACACSLLALAAALPACGSKAKSSSSGGSDICNLDFSSLDPTPVSFKNDVLPIFGLSCIQSDCHNVYDSNPRAALQLGPKCQFDIQSGVCSYPATPQTDDTSPNPMVSDPQPITSQIAATVYQNLLLPSTTVTSQQVARVAPGDPGHSFLILKLANKQNSFNFQCMNQDPSHEANPPPCGVGMPQQTSGVPASFCDDPADDGPQRVDTVARWIAQGAMNDFQ